MMLRTIGHALNHAKKNVLLSSLSRTNLCNATRSEKLVGVNYTLSNSLQNSNQNVLIKRNFHTSRLRRNEKEPQKNNKKDGKNNKEENNNKETGFTVSRELIFAGFTMWVALYFIMRNNKNSSMQEAQKVSWLEFVNLLLAKGEVREIKIYPDLKKATILLHDGAVVDPRFVNKFLYLIVENPNEFEEKIRNTEASLGVSPQYGIPISFERQSLGDYALNTGIIIFLAYMLIRSIRRMMPKSSETSTFSNMFSQFTKAKFTMIDPHIPGAGRGVRFSDVAGAKEAKQEVMEFVDFLKNPDKYRSLGAKVPKGALLLGPPGCGKTLLAKAIATEGRVPFLSMNGPEFIEVIGGLGAARVRDLFKEARKRSPCIIYIDEIDAIGKKRSTGMSTGHNSEGEQTLNQLLVEMDGLLTSTGVIILASTNRVDVLDDALLRPGRFDRHIIMDLPTKDERKEIFEHHLQRVTLENPASCYSKRMSTLTLGFSGADIANVCNEAALYAARMKKKVVDGKDLEYAIEKVIGGTEKVNKVVSADERRVVAYHESGHALVGWLLEHTDALLKVTIIPRTNHALGFAQYSPQEKKLYTKEEIDEKMCMALGGRVAESIAFNRITTGAQNDLEKVTQLAYAQVRTFGFSKEVGQVSFPEEENRTMGKRIYSKKLSAVIDQEVNRIIFEAYKKTEKVLLQNKELLSKLAEELLKKETLNYDDVVQLLGPPKYDKSFVEPAQFEQEINSWENLEKTEESK